MTKVHLHKVQRPAHNKPKRQVWMLRWWGTDGKRYGEIIGEVARMTKRDAEYLCRERQGKMDSGEIRTDKPKRMTLADYLKLDRETIAPDVKPSTIAVHKTVSGHAIAALGGDTQLGEINWSHIAKLKNWLGQKHKLNGRTLPSCSKATIRRSIVTLKAAFNRAVNRGFITTNPFVGQKLVKVQSKQKRIYSPEEVACMVEAAPDLWWQAFIRLGFTSGLRLGELLNLTWADIEEANGQVIVSAKRAGRFNVGGKSYPILCWSCKDYDERHVPLHPDASALLRKLRVKAGGSIYVFLSLKRLDRLDAVQDTTKEIPAAKLVNNYLRIFKAIQADARTLLAKRCGVGIGKVERGVGSVHDLRKSYGTHMAKLVPIHELQRLMGHEDISTTAKYYLDATGDVAEKVRMAFASGAAS